MASECELEFLSDWVHNLSEQQTTMPTSHLSRIFASGSATTLYVTISAQIVSDSPFPFEADDTVTVPIDDNQLVITPNSEGADT